MRYAPALMATLLLSLRFGDLSSEMKPSEDDVQKAARDGVRYARKLGGGSGGGLKNKAFCNAMAARAFHPPFRAFIGSDPEQWRKTRNALKRQRKLMRNR